VGLLGSAFPLSMDKTSELLVRLLGVSISCGAIVAIHARLAACLREPTEEALREARQQPVVYMDQIGAPTGNADGSNAEGRRGWLWVLMTPMLTMFSQGLSRSSAAAMKLLRPSFGGIVVSDRFSVTNQLALKQRQLCWAHIIRYFFAVAEGPGATLRWACDC
jgi:transposase